MIHTHSLGRARSYYPERTAFAASEERTTFRELHDRVGRIAAALTNHGFRKGDRLGLLLPNRSEEHTSELQSQSNLVCRLLLEKKKRLRPSPKAATASCSSWRPAPARPIP